MRWDIPSVLFTRSCDRSRERVLNSGSARLCTVFWQRREVVSVSLVALWLAENRMNVSVYMRDAIPNAKSVIDTLHWDGYHIAIISDSFAQEFCTRQLNWALSTYSSVLDYAMIARVTLLNQEIQMSN